MTECQSQCTVIMLCDIQFMLVCPAFEISAQGHSIANLVCLWSAYYKTNLLLCAQNATIFRSVCWTVTRLFCLCLLPPCCYPTLQCPSMAKQSQTLGVCNKSESSLFFKCMYWWEYLHLNHHVAGGMEPVASGYILYRLPVPPLTAYTVQTELRMCY